MPRSLGQAGQVGLRSTGSATLDAEALAMIERAQPFPVAPPEVDELNFTLPVNFNSRRPPIDPLKEADIRKQDTAVREENSAINADRSICRGAETVHEIPSIVVPANAGTLPPAEMFYKVVVIFLPIIQSAARMRCRATQRKRRAVKRAVFNSQSVKLDARVKPGHDGFLTRRRPWRAVAGVALEEQRLAGDGGDHRGLERL